MTTTRRLAAGRRERRVGAPRRPSRSAGTSASADAVPLAVVELDQPFVDLDAEPCTAAIAAAVSRARTQRAATTRARPVALRRAVASRRRLINTELAERSVDAALQPAVAVVRGLPVTNERDHAAPSSTIASRPVRRNSTAARRIARARSASTSTTRRRVRAALRSRRRAAAASNGASGRSVPNAGHQNTSLCAHERAQHQAREPADREAQRASAAQPVAPARGERHREHEHEHRGEQRVRVRLRAERAVEQRAARAHPIATSRKSSPVLWKTFQTPKIGSEREPQDHARRVQRPFTSASASVFVLTAHVRDLDGFERVHAASRACCASGRRFGCLIFQRPRIWFDDEHRVGRGSRRAGHRARRQPRARRSAPGTRRRCSWSRRCTRSPRRAAHRRVIEHDRADRRRPRVPARATVAVRDLVELSRRLAWSRDENCAAVVAVGDLVPVGAADRSASVDGIVRWHALQVVPTSRAAPAPLFCVRRCS